MRRSAIALLLFTIATIAPARAVDHGQPNDIKFRDIRIRVIK